MSQKHYAYFSAAIRDGARLGLQARKVFWNEADGSLCAFGAGMKALGMSHYEDVYTHYPYLHGRVDCPACEHRDCPIPSVIYHLNDEHEWTREAIADWLYAEEEKLGFVTVVETEALNTEMIAEPETVNATV